MVPSTTAPPAAATDAAAAMRAAAAKRRSVRSSVSRRRLSNAQKLELCEFCFAHRHLGYDEIAIWAANHFNLKLPLGTRTVGRILSNYETLRGMTAEELQYKRTPSEAWRQLETRLRDWIVRLAEQGMHIDGQMIRIEAERLRNETRDEGLRSCNFTAGWLCSFQERHSISLRSLQLGGSVIVTDKPQNRKRKPNAPGKAPSKKRPAKRKTSTQPSP